MFTRGIVAASSNALTSSVQKRFEVSFGVDAANGPQDCGSCQILEHPRMAELAAHSEVVVGLFV